MKKTTVCFVTKNQFATISFEYRRILKPAEVANLFKLSVSHEDDFAPFFFWYLTNPNSVVIDQYQRYEQTSVVYIIRLNGGGICVYDNGKRLLSFDTVDKLAKVQLQNNFERFNKKVVRFKYNGGSNNGGERLVKVESVGTDRLNGYDLRVDSLESSMRQYLFEKIEDIKEV
jgi:hypothetical protein